MRQKYENVALQNYIG